MTALIHFLWKKIGKSLPLRRFKKGFYQGSSRTFDHLKAKVPQIPQKCFIWTKELGDTCRQDIQELGGVDRTHPACMWGNQRQVWILNSMLWIPNSRCWILDSLSVALGFHIPTLEGSGFLEVNYGFQRPRCQIPQAKLFQIADSKSKNSRITLHWARTPSLQWSMVKPPWTSRRQSHLVFVFFKGSIL